MQYWLSPAAKIQRTVSDRRRKPVLRWLRWIFRRRLRALTFFQRRRQPRQHLFLAAEHTRQRDGDGVKQRILREVDHRIFGTDVGNDQRKQVQRAFAALAVHRGNQLWQERVGLGKAADYDLRQQHLQIGNVIIFGVFIDKRLRAHTGQLGLRRQQTAYKRSTVQLADGKEFICCFDIHWRSGW